jgi:thioesterase domain-containing protein/SAM-dependent methyltransferase/acyl carrier protein
VTEHVQQWKSIFDDLYAEVDKTQQPSLYVKGWEDSYTGLPIPTEEVREWADHTAERIRSLHPNRLMEIGCGGSGLMLFRLAPDCAEYFATDLSENSLSVLRHQLTVTGSDLSNITLKQRDAANFEGIAPHSFDTLISVSVVQYFPDINYLVGVLEEAVRAVAPSGRIFLGDVRSLPLLEAFHTSVQLSLSPDALPTAKLRQRIQQQVLREKQLVIDPVFFIALQEHLPEVDQVEILLERGRSHNELTRYRYDVVLNIRQPEDEPGHVEVDWLDWEGDGVTLASLRQLLTEKEPPLVHMSGVPNARLMSEVEAVRLLKPADGPATVGELRETLREFEGAGVDPEDLWSLGEELSYAVSITYYASGADGKCSVVMTRDDVDGGQARRAILAAKASRPRLSRVWSDYANAPWQGMLTAEITPKLRGFLSSQLPDYMMPSSFVLQNSLPLTPSGKVDRRALPAPDGEAAELPDTYVAPRDTLELELARLWEEVLGVEPISVESNFFELGGHSLLAVRLFALIERKFGLKMPLAALFRSPTVAQLASSLRQQTTTAAAQTSALVEIRSGGMAQPFFCIHPISGHVLCYAGLSRHLGPGQPFYGLQSLGVAGEEFAHTKVEEMAAHYIEALRVVQPTGPYLLGGWSMGGYVAYEMAQQLHSVGQEVALLSLIDSYAPPFRHEVEDEASLLKGFAQDLGLPLEKLSISAEQFNMLPPDEQLSYALEGAKRAKVIHPDVSPEQIRSLYNLFKINVGAMKSYRPRPYRGRVTLFSAQDKPVANSYDPTLGWSNLATAGVDLHDIPGDHYSIVREPHVKTLAERLTICLHTTVAE